ncbi:hypothetical protein Tco_1515061 [Tanacetum coccineum]
MGSFIKWYCKRIGKSKLTKADLEGPAFKLVRPFHKNSISLKFQMEECHLLLTYKIDLTNPECNQVVPDVSKPLPLGGPPGQIKSERDYDISAAYDISHWWFKRKEFYITRHGASSDRHAIRSHMKILSNLNHLYGSDKVALFNAVKLWIRNIIIKRRMKDLDRNNYEKLMRETEVHKFSDGTLTRILEKLDHMVKDFGMFKFNPGMENRIWFDDDKRRSK